MKREKDVRYNVVACAFVLLVIGSIFAGAVSVSAEEGTTIFEDDFSALNLDNWSPFGSPSPRVLASVEGRNGVFDNNGDSWCDSGVVSKDTFSFPNGFTMESDIYVKVTNMAGCWDAAVIGLTKENTPYWDHPNCPGEGYYTGLVFGIFYTGDACWATPPEKRRHAYFRIGLYTEDGTGEGPGSYAINADDYINGWHNLKIVVGEDRFVSFYCDDNLIYKSEKRIHEDILLDKKIYLGQRSCGWSAGKAYHDYIRIDKGGEEGKPDLMVSDLSAEPSPCIAGRDATFRFKISNVGEKPIPAGSYTVYLDFYDEVGKWGDSFRAMGLVALGEQSEKVADKQGEIVIENPINPGENVERSINVKMISSKPFGEEPIPFWFINRLDLFVEPGDIGDPDLSNNKVMKDDLFVTGDPLDFMWGCTKGILTAIKTPLVESVAKELGELASEGSGEATAFIAEVTNEELLAFKEGLWDNHDFSKFLEHWMKIVIKVGEYAVEKGKIVNVASCIVDCIIGLLQGAWDCGSIVTLAEMAVTAANNEGYQIHLWEVLPGGTDILIVDDAGNRVGVVNGIIYEEIEGSGVLVNDEAKIIILPEGMNYDINIQGTEESILQILHLCPIDAGSLKNLYYKVEVLEGTVITSRYEAGGNFNNLFVDIDGNGKVDEEIEPIELETLPPILLGGNVNPTSGFEDTTFTYTVTYTGERPPTNIQVIIDEDLQMDMVKQDKDDDGYVDGCIYELSLKGSDLGIGDHSFRFEANDGNLEAIGDVGQHQFPSVKSKEAYGVPILTPIGLAALIGLLSIIVISKIRRREN